MSKRTLRQRTNWDLPQLQNRKGPGGMDLDPDEAAAWFPPLSKQAHQFDGAIDAHCDVLVGYAGFQFWLCNVETSVEPGFYFGKIAECLPENDAALDKDHEIGFERCHVIRVRQMEAA